MLMRNEKGRKKEESKVKNMYVNVCNHSLPNSNSICDAMYIVNVVRV